MPSSMREEHERILANWVKRDHWDNIGKVRNIFGLNKNDACFSLFIYLKIIQREDSVNIIATCFQDNDQDFMIINDSGVIDGAGYKFRTLLGSKVVGLPLKLVCSEYTYNASKTKVSRFFGIRSFS